MDFPASFIGGGGLRSIAYFEWRAHTLKAFLLAGGHGTRLRPLTDSVPKCLVPIRGRPLLDIWLDLCARSGITEVLINLHAHSQLIEQHLKRSGSAA